MAILATRVTHHYNGSHCFSGLTCENDVAPARPRTRAHLAHTARRKPLGHHAALRRFRYAQNSTTDTTPYDLGDAPVLDTVLTALQYEIPTPASYGAFHLCWLAASLGCAALLITRPEPNHERRLKTVLGVYGFTALALELAKQIVWSYTDGVWDYRWYAAPFQLCTMPIYASIAAFFMPKCRLRDALLAFVAFVTILGSIATAAYPTSCFVETLLVDVHTMFLHLGSLAVSLYLLAREVRCDYRSYLRGFAVFLVAVACAEALNVGVYASGILDGETFNMFYISPYFVSSLPVFCDIQPQVPFALFLALYVLAIFLGSNVVYATAKLLHKTAKAR